MPVRPLTPNGVEVVGVWLTRWASYRAAAQCHFPPLPWIAEDVMLLRRGRISAGLESAHSGL